VTLAGHPQLGLEIAGKMLVLPQLVGSSSSSAVLLELIHAGRAPKALILGARDAILPIGAVVARQMGWGALPVVVMETGVLRTGDRVGLSETGEVWTL
jgi:predicted aconitase with swiveling domain